MTKITPITHALIDLAEEHYREMSATERSVLRRSRERATLRGNAWSFEWQLLADKYLGDKQCK